MINWLCVRAPEVRQMARVNMGSRVMRRGGWDPGRSRRARGRDGSACCRRGRAWAACQSHEFGRRCSASATFGCASKQTGELLPTMNCHGCRGAHAWSILKRTLEGGDRCRRWRIEAEGQIQERRWRIAAGSCMQGMVAAAQRLMTSLESMST